MKKETSPLTAALIITLLLFVVDIIAGFAHFKFATWYRWIPLIILIVAIIWACVNHASQKNGDVTFGNVFAFGFKTSAVIACLSVITVLISIFLIFPDTKDMALDQARKQMEEQGKLSDEQINTALEITKKFFLPFAIGGAIIGTIIIGAIASLLGAAFAKKNPNAPFENQMK
jgi:hypothetical protein